MDSVTENILKTDYSEKFDEIRKALVVQSSMVILVAVLIL